MSSDMKTSVRAHVCVCVCLCFIDYTCIIYFKHKYTSVYNTVSTTIFSWNIRPKGEFLKNSRVTKVNVLTGRLISDSP